jgi:flagella basal body P-ring formation protein FlgA
VHRARLLGLLVVLAAAALALVRPAQAGVTVQTAAEVVVSRDEIMMGDLGAIEGDPGLVERLRGVRLGPAPAPGTSFPMEYGRIAMILRQQHIDPAQVSLIGSDRIVVVRAYQTVTGSALVEAASRVATERLETLRPQDGPPAVVALSHPVDQRVATGNVELVPRVQDPTPPYTFATASVSVRVDGREVQVVPVTFRVAHLMTVVVASQPLEPRTVLSLADFRLEARPSTEVPQGALEAISNVGDLEAVRTIRAGEVVTQRMVRPKVVVKRGDAVTLVLEGRGFRVTTQALAAEDARRGDRVRVVNPDSKREILGRVEGPGQVRVSQ